MKRLAITTLGVVAALAAAAMLFVWSGLYNIGASSRHFAPTRHLLEFAMHSSVRTWSFGIDVPALQSAAMVERGAGHYDQGCKPCHGAPGTERSPVARAMLPRPPFLPEAVDSWEPAELFWIIKHGLKYTGMPAWPAQNRDDEVWAVVAFLRRLPGLTAVEYRQLAQGDARIQDLPAGRPAALERCVQCHGLDGAGRGTGAFPRLAGQNAGYLYQSLRSFAAGRRGSGMMELAASGLDDPAMRELAEYYARARDAPGAAALELPENSDISRGRRLAEKGAADVGVPACAPCHGVETPPTNPLYPALAGQYSNYLITQLKLWNEGKRGGAPYAHIMSQAAWKLTDQQIRDVSAYYSQLKLKLPEK